MKNQQRGFTLIEILVVVMIVAIVAGASTVALNLGGDERDYKKAIERFVVVSEHISELAILGGEPIGLLLEPPEWRENPLDEGWRYSWLKMTDQGWQPVAEVEPIDFPVGMRLDLYQQDIHWEYKKAPEIKVPQIAFYPSGEVSPFEIEFTHEALPGESQTVYVDVWGKVSWKEWEEAEEARKELLEQYED